jgi:hypothetical protein
MQKAPRHRPWLNEEAGTPHAADGFQSIDHCQHSLIVSLMSKVFTSNDAR